MSDNTTQRDELQAVIYGYFGPPSQIKPYKKSPVEQDRELAETILAKGYRKPRTIRTIGDMAGIVDGTVFRTVEGHVFEVQGGRLLRTDSTTWWSPLASWLPITVLDEPAATCTGADSCDAIAHVHGCFAEATR